jgi:hypothetical protein
MRAPNVSLPEKLPFSVVRLQNVNQGQNYKVTVSRVRLPADA